MTNKLRQLFETYGVMSIRKQRAFANYLGQHAWEYEKAGGTMSFPAQGVQQAESRIFPAQVLGSESATSQTWLWAWANAESSFPPAQLEAAERLRAFGAEHDIEELTTPKLPLDRVGGHLLASLALGLLDFPAYYRGGVGGTHLVCLLSGTPELPPLTAIELLGTLNDAMSSFDFRNHRQAVEAFFQQLGWPAQWEGRFCQVTADDQARVTLEFDERDRLKKLSTKSAAPTT